MDEALDFFHEYFPAERIYRILRRKGQALGEGTPALELPPQERAATRGTARTDWARLTAHCPGVAKLRGLEALQELLERFGQALNLPSPRTLPEEEIRQAYRSALEQAMELELNPFELAQAVIEERLEGLLEALVWRRRALERGVPEAWVWGWSGWDWIRITLARASRDRLRAMGLEGYLERPPEVWAPHLEDAWLVPWYSDDYHEVFFRRLSGEPDLLPLPESYLPPNRPRRSPARSTRPTLSTPTRGPCASSATTSPPRGSTRSCGMRCAAWTRGTRCPSARSGPPWAAMRPSSRSTRPSARRWAYLPRIGPSSSTPGAS